MPVIAATHTPVNSGRPASHRFGAGILPNAGHVIPQTGRRMPYTVQDLADAALMFADSQEPDWDAMALEAELQDRYERQAPTIFGRCLVCSVVTDALEPNGLCPRCDIHACETSTPNRYR